MTTRRPVRRYRLVHPWRLVSVLLATLILTGVTAWGINGFPLLRSPAGAHHGSTRTTPAPPTIDRDQPLWVLLLGVDERAEDGGRTDAVLLARLDPRRRTLHLLSLPRDTRVDMPDGRPDRLNAAYAHGGVAATLQVVSELVNRPVRYYVKTNLQGFRQAIDALGGITVEVDRRMRYQDPYQDLVIDLWPGRQRLDGDRALQFLRFRLSDDGQHDASNWN